MATLLTLDKYFPVPEGAKYFTTKDDSAAIDIEGALSFGFFDQIVSRKRNYRNILSAGDLGREWETSAISAYYPEAKDDRYTPTAPRNEPCTTTFMAFMSAANGTGNCIALIEAELFEQFSPGIPTRY